MNTGVYSATFTDRFDDATKIVVGQDHVRGSLGHLRALHDTPQKRRLLALSVFEALVRVVAAYEGATSASVAGLAALAYASDAAAFLTEAYVHPGPRMPPPETGRDDLAPGLAHAIVAVLVYALLARRRRCCESKQRSGKRE